MAPCSAVLELLLGGSNERADDQVVEVDLERIGLQRRRANLVHTALFSAARPIDLLSAVDQSTR